MGDRLGIPSAVDSFIFRTLPVRVLLSFKIVSDPIGDTLTNLGAAQSNTAYARSFVRTYECECERVIQLRRADNNTVSAYYDYVVSSRQSITSGPRRQPSFYPSKMCPIQSAGL